MPESTPDSTNDAVADSADGSMRNSVDDAVPDSDDDLARDSVGAVGRSGRKRFKVLLRGAISVVLMVVIVTKVGPDELLDSLGRVGGRWGWLIVALVVPRLVGWGISSVRWQLLLRSQVPSVRLGDVSRALLLGTFFSQFLPSSIGGDGYRAWYMGRRVGGLANSLSSIVIERGLGAMALCLLAIAGVVIHPEWFDSVPALRVFVPLLGVLMVLGGAFLWWFKPPAMDADDAAGVAWWRKKWHRFATALGQYRSNPGVLMLAAMYSVLLQLNIVVHFWALGWCLGVDTPLDRYLVAVPITTLATMLPLSFNGIGVREWTLIWISQPFGIREADTAMIAILFVVSGFLLAGGGGYLFARTSNGRPDAMGKSA
jgi:glycosyltransferase 2 family protein